MVSATIEVRNNNCELLAVLKNAFNITITENLKEIPMISLSIPSGDENARYLTPANWIWIRQTGVPTKIFKIYKQSDKR